MPHLHTNPGEHDHTVTAYIIRIDGSEPKALLHMHKKLSKLLAIGGHIEFQETPWQAIGHELQEESGYRLPDLEILQPKDRIKTLSDVVLHPYPIAMNTHPINEDHSHNDTAYAFIAHSDPSLAISEGESLDIRWYTQNELHAIEDDQINSNTREVYDFIFDSALEKWSTVPTK